MNKNETVATEVILLEAERQLTSMQEAFEIAIEAAIQLLELGVPAIRNRQNLLAWSHLGLTIETLRKELK
jgi:hypothetical protein